MTSTYTIQEKAVEVPNEVIIAKDKADKANAVYLAEEGVKAEAAALAAEVKAKEYIETSAQEAKITETKIKLEDDSLFTYEKR